jgi:hypothetical protein
LPIDVGQLLGGAFGGAVASSVLGPLVTQRKERRDLRAEVLRQIGQVEQARWAGVPWNEFRTAVVALRAAALVAGASRELVDRYIFLAQAARQTSDASAGLYPGEEGGGAISPELGRLVDGAATLLADHLWHPIRNRVSVQRRLAQSRNAEAKLRAANTPHWLRTQWPASAA